jgi:hypothetical protein
LAKKLAAPIFVSHLNTATCEGSPVWHSICNILSATEAYSVDSIGGIRMKRFLALPLFGALALFATQSAFGALVLTVSDDIGNSVTINDNGAGDTANTTTNFISWTGNVGHWGLNVVSGLSKDQAAPSLLDIGYQLIYNAPASGPLGNNLTVLLTDTFGGTIPSITVELGGTKNAGGSIQGGACTGTVINSGTDINCNAIAFTSVFTTSPYSGAGAATGGSSGLAAALLATAPTTGRWQTSGDLNVSAVPEPASMSLFGAVLLGAAALARKKGMGRS